MVVCRYLGDVLLATPLAQSLAQAGYRVDWVVASGTGAILEQQPYADTVYTVDHATSWGNQLRLGTLLFRKYEKAFVLPASDRSMVLALAASGKAYALITAGRRQDAWKRRLTCRWIACDDSAHMVSHALQLSQAAGLPACRNIRIHWSDADGCAVAGHLPWKSSGSYAHLHPFARWPYKLWNTEGWRYLFDHLLERGINVVLTGAPAEAAPAHALAKGYARDKVCVLAGELNWRQLACLSARASAYVGLDTANTHLAASTGAPVIALFGPTDPRVWGPWPNGFDGKTPWRASSENGVQRAGNISLLQGTQDCLPCQLEGCERRPDSDSACLQGMAARQVWREICRRLPEETALKPSPCDGQSSASNADG